MQNPRTSVSYHLHPCHHLLHPMKTVRRLLQFAPRLPVGNYCNQCHKVAYTLVYIQASRPALRLNPCPMNLLRSSPGRSPCLSSILWAGSPMPTAITNTLNNFARLLIRIHIPRASSPYFGCEFMIKLWLTIVEFIQVAEYHKRTPR